MLSSKPPLRKCKDKNNNNFSESKYEILRKNANLHLCYIYLMANEYSNVIKTGNGILRNLNPNAQTRFQVL